MQSKWQYLTLSIILSGLLFACPAVAKPVNSPDHAKHREQDTTAVHGMVLFGNQQLYISHLGLYHPPHDRQIIAAVEIRDSDAKRRFDKMRANYTGLITIAPKAFPLANLAPEAVSFQTEIVADFYMGHFERGGKQALSNVVLTLQKPIIYQQLHAKLTAPKHAQFWQLGQGDNAFIVYRISHAPDQDYIAKVKSSLNCEGLCELQYNAKRKGPELRFPTQQAHEFIADDNAISIMVERNIYYETQDFKQ
ncbi:hypothetical protein R50072_38230 [Simiduia litorea]|uniref:hypothetical protein n=1 Tax=Simiduia litorea TaxID=1435348 RepID=UPI0036F41DD7